MAILRFKSGPLLPPDDMQLIVISGKVDIAGNLSELTGSI